MTPAEALPAYIAFVRSYDGCTALSDPQRFGEACAPNGPDSARAFFLEATHSDARESSCIVVGCGIATLFLRSLGLSLLTEPLDNAAGAWGRFTALAKAHGALRSPEDPGPGLRVGCVVLVEGATGRHEYTIVEHIDESFVWVSIDGGGNDRGHQAIHCVPKRVITGSYYDQTSAKPVSAWIDMQALLEALLAEPADAPVEG